LFPGIRTRKERHKKGVTKEVHLGAGGEERPERGEGRGNKEEAGERGLSWGGNAPLRTDR